VGIAPVAAQDDGGIVVHEGGVADAQPDAPIDSSSGGACQPGSSQFYKPAEYRPATGLYLGACTMPQIDDFYTWCLDPQARDAGACDSFKTDTSTSGCSSCILTPDTAMRYGPIIQHMAVAQANLPGCIELLDPGNLKCATAVQELFDCEIAVCAPSCPVTDQASFDRYTACVTEADTTSCSTYAAAAACADYEADGGPASRCFQATFADFYKGIVPLFCATYDGNDSGGSPPDGGGGG
jgi:hypothetical protein